MVGTIQGGKKAAATNKLRHGNDFYARIGQRGGAERTYWGISWKSGTSSQSWTNRRSEEQKNWRA